MSTGGKKTKKCYIHLQQNMVQLHTVAQSQLTNKDLLCSTERLQKHRNTNKWSTDITSDSQHLPHSTFIIPVFCLQWCIWSGPIFFKQLRVRNHGLLCSVIWSLSSAGEHQRFINFINLVKSFHLAELQGFTALDLWPCATCYWKWQRGLLNWKVFRQICTTVPFTKVEAAAADCLLRWWLFWLNNNFKNWFFFLPTGEILSSFSST